MGGLAKVIRKINVEEDNREKSNKAQMSEMDAFSKSHSDDFQIDLYQIYDSYLKRLDSQSNQAQKNIEALQPELKEEQMKVKKARVKKRVIELLKEKQKEEYQEEFRKYQRKELEEINYLRLVNANQNTTIGTESENKIYKGIKKQLQGSTDEDDENIEQDKSDGDQEYDAIAEYYKQLGFDPP